MLNLPVETEAMISALSQMVYGVFNATKSSEILNIEELLNAVDLCVKPENYVEVAKNLAQVQYSLGLAYGLITDQLNEVKNRESILSGELYEMYKLDGDANPLFGKISKPTDKLITSLIDKDREVADYRATAAKLKTCRDSCAALRDMVKSLQEIAKFVVENKDTINLTGYASPEDIKKIAQKLRSTVDNED